MLLALFHFIYLILFEVEVEADFFNYSFSLQQGKLAAAFG